MEQYALTFDFGSGSVKAALVDGQHRIVASFNKPYPIYYPRKGWVVQQPDTAWSCMQEAAREVMAASGLLPGQVKGIALSHTGSSIIFVDRQGCPLSDCVMWMDGRGVVQAGMLNERLGKPLFTGKNVIAKLCWFLEHEPELVERSHRMLDLGGFLLHRMTGQMVYEFTSARTTRLFDVYSGKWDEEMFRVSGFPRRLAPERVVRSHDLVGRLLPEAAGLLGVAAGTPVFGGCCDHATAMLGAGCIRPGDAHIYIGTSAWLAVAAEGYADEASIRPSPIPGQWYHYMENDSGGSCVDYLVRTYYQKELAEGEDAYALVEEESADASAYRDLLFLPFLTGASAPINDVRVRASLLNLEASTTRGQIARAVLEGIGFNLLWLKEFYQKNHKWQPNFLRGIGGGMLLPQSIQTIANILGDPVATLRDPRFAGNIGLAVCVEVGLGEHSEGYAVLEKTVACDRVFHPQQEHRERYDRLYAIYKDSFHALSGIYGRLNSQRDKE